VISQLATFLGVSAVVIVTPGPDTALTIRNSFVGGRRAGIHTAAGVACGQAIWAVAACAGVAAVLRASEPAFTALRVVGAAYLAYLGLQAFVAAVRREPGHVRTPPTGGGRGRTALRQGLLSNLGNPKMAVFFTSLLPQFGGSWVGLLVLGLVFSALTLTWLSAYAVVVVKAGERLLRPRVRRVLDAATGAVLVALGVRLAGERR
jgi:threonine/homoserine/homoserine lactone efflux protein